MRFAVLGPLAVSGEQGHLALGGPKPRTLMAMLLLERNTVVSRYRLIEALWPDGEPPSAAQSLDVYVHRLRKELGPDRLVRRDGGYMLRVEPGELDTDEFQRLRAAAAQATDIGDRAAAVEALSTGVALWRGPAWADMLDLAPASVDAQRLDDQRVEAIESCVEIELALGRGRDLVSELERLVSEHPLRERLIHSLMLALYRAGRQAAALDVFRSARARLVGELGIEPGPELHQLQQRILSHDPALGARRPVVPIPTSRPVRMLAIIAAIAAAVAGGVVVITAGGEKRPRAFPPGSSGVVAVAVRSGRPAVSVATALAGTPSGVTVSSGSVWVADASNGTVSRIDPATGAQVDRINVGGDPASITSGAGAIWVANVDGATVLRIDPTTGTVTQTIPLGGANPDALTFGAGRLWVADSTTRMLYELDPATGHVLPSIPLDVSPVAITFGSGRLWAAGYDRATVLSLDPSSRRIVGRVKVGTGPSSLAFAAGDLWVANRLDSTISRIDPRRLEVRATIPVGSGPAAITSDAESVWVANQYSGTLSRLDPQRDTATTTLAVGGQPVSLASDGALWVGVQASASSHRGGALQIASAARYRSIDPGFFFGAEPTQFDGMVYDTLVTFDHAGGTAGLRLVPDLALTLPTPTDGGRTYTFHLRPGIRYSNGVPVRADDFRRAIERLFRARAPGTDFYTDIAGAAGCMAQPSGCDLSRGIATDNAAGTIVFHLSAPDPEFLYQLTEQDYTAPIPPGTPDHDTGLSPIPGTGPYRIAHAGPTGFTFARNRLFREWSHAAQPDGNPDTIVWRIFPTQHAAASAVRDRRADWFYGSIALADYRRIAIQSPAQLHAHPLFAVEYLPLNVHIRPFDHLLARRALNYAIDRDRIAQLYGGPAFATPTCQALTPGLPGYRRTCPYTSHPSANGAYTGPDLATARRLVTASGTRGDKVELLGSTDEGYIPPELPSYVASVLRALGYRTTLHLAPNASVPGAMLARFPINTHGDWLADYPDPSSYIPSFLTCNGAQNHHLFCNPTIDRQVRRAESLELTAPEAADALWTSIDRTLTDQAAWVPTVTPRVVDLVSKRLGNYQFNPLWGFLADQSWVH